MSIWAPNGALGTVDGTDTTASTKNCSQDPTRGTTFIYIPRDISKQISPYATQTRGKVHFLNLKGVSESTKLIVAKTL